MYIFILGHHPGFGLCEGVEQGKIWRGSKREVEKMAPHPPPPPPLFTNPLPAKNPITIQDGDVDNLIYQAFHSKIMPALQAIDKGEFSELLSQNDSRTLLIEFGRTVFLETTVW